MSPLDVQDYLQATWDLYAPQLAPIVDVNLPPDVEARFKAFFDDLDLAGVPGLPDWVMQLYWVQDAITSALYRQRRIAEIEARVIEVLAEVHGSVPGQPWQMNTSPRTQTLSYEYQAYLFDYRRVFEYLKGGIAGAFGVEVPDHARDLPTSLRTSAAKYQSHVAPMNAKLADVATRFSRVLAKKSPRNTHAHHQPVDAGNVRVWLEPGQEPHVAVEGGGEGLPMRDFPGGTKVRLAVALQAQLETLVQAVFELLTLLPNPGEGLDIRRLE